MPRYRVRIGIDGAFVILEDKSSLLRHLAMHAVRVEPAMLADVGRRPQIFRSKGRQVRIGQLYSIGDLRTSHPSPRVGRPAFHEVEYAADGEARKGTYWADLGPRSWWVVTNGEFVAINLSTGNPRRDGRHPVGTYYAVGAYVTDEDDKGNGR